MKPWLVCVLALICLVGLAACRPVETPPTIERVLSTVTDAPVTQTAPLLSSPTFTPSATITASPVSPTRTPMPSRTPRPTNTPLPTDTSIPPFVRGLQPTLTSAAPAQCPQITVTGPVPTPSFLDLGFQPATNPVSLIKDVIGYLNKFGPEALRLSQYLSPRDLTQDGIPELVLKMYLGGMDDSYYIFGCRDGAYQVLFQLATFEGGDIIIAIEDANRNGLPEILTAERFDTGGGHDYNVYEWDGSQFGRVLDDEFIYASLDGRASFQDIDGDYLRELVVITGVPVGESYYSGLPWRSHTKTYKWDGVIYRLERSDPDVPKYRFQALQDADYYAELGEYERAQALYQAVIFDPDLGLWSLELHDYQREVGLSLAWGQPTPTTMPTPDPNEYGHLAAYARFRLMLLHLLRGWDTEAQTVYAGLQKEFPAGAPGAVFAEMAAQFWAQYQAGDGMGASCQAAVAYANNHPQGLYYLGGSHHGWDARIYEANMLCPFK